VSALVSWRSAAADRLSVNSYERVVRRTRSSEDKKAVQTKTGSNLSVGVVSLFYFVSSRPELRDGRDGPVHVGERQKPCPWQRPARERKKKKKKRKKRVSFDGAPNQRAEAVCSSGLQTIGAPPRSFPFCVKSVVVVPVVVHGAFSGFGAADPNRPRKREQGRIEFDGAACAKHTLFLTSPVPPLPCCTYRALRRAISRSPASYRWATPKATNSHGPGHDARTNDVCQFQLRPNLLPASNGCLAPCLDEQHNCPDTGSYLLARLGM
jgi:hypothetical protein